MGIVTIGELLSKSKRLAKRRRFQGLDISVETAAGEHRHWYDPHADRHGKTQMPHDYGYVRGSIGADGDHVDCYVGPHEDAPHAYVINQMKAPHFLDFDEQKVMLGFKSEAEAKAAYLRCYDNPLFFGSMREVPMDDFRAQVLSTTKHQPLVMSERALTRFPRLHTLSTSLLKARPTAPAGFSAIPRGKHGGYRKQVGGKWVYWYPSAHESEPGRHAPAEVTEDDFEAGRFDKDAAHWHFIRAGAGRSDILSWTAGGVDPHSKHPVKIAGREAQLYQIVDPEAEAGWAKLRDVHSGETVIIKHDRVYPVEHGRRAVREAPPAPPAGSGGHEPPKAPATGWTPGTESRLQPWPGSTAKPGTMLHNVENGHYPRKQRRVWREDEDGLPHQVTDEVLFMPEGDKVALLGEMQGLVRKAAEHARRKLGIEKSDAVVEDLRAASMEGLLHAIDNYRGGYSFAKSAMSYADQYARLHAAREFAGGFGLRKREARMLSGFLAARAEANRLAESGEDASAEAIARNWRLKKRDRHEGLISGRNDLIPMGRYSLRDGEIVAGDDKPGRVELAMDFMEFIDGQKSAVDFGDEPGAGAAIAPGGRAGYGLTPQEQAIARYDLGRALDRVKTFEVVVAGVGYRVNAAEVVRRRLGLDEEPHSPRAIADSVPFYKLQRTGELRRVSPRLAHDLVAPTVTQALDHVRGDLEGPVAGIAERAWQNLREPEVVPGGPTMKQYLEAESRKVTTDDVRAWRASERVRLTRLAARYHHAGDETHANQALHAARRLLSIGRREATRHIALQRIMQQPQTREWIRSATIPVPTSVYSPGGHGETLRVTDPGTGKQHSLRVHTFEGLARSDSAFKSEGEPGKVPPMSAVHWAGRFPRLAHTLFGGDDPLAYAPTLMRAQVLEAVGL